MLFYYRCKYVLDFYIVLFLSMLSQAVVLNKKNFLIFCTNSSSLFFSFRLGAVPDASGPASFRRNGGQVNVTLHRGQGFNLASRPAPFPLPQAAGGANAQPAVASGLADDLFVVVDVGYPSDGHHAGLQHLWVWTAFHFRADYSFMQSPRAESLTCTCCFDGSWTIAVPLTLRSKTPLVPSHREKM